MKTYDLDQARKNLHQLIASVQLGNRFIIKTDPKNKAVMISIREYESLLETLEILQDQELLDDIFQSEKGYEQGKLIPLQAL